MEWKMLVNLLIFLAAAAIAIYIAMQLVGMGPAIGIGPAPPELVPVYT